jgi:hypothetical protein
MDKIEIKDYAAWRKHFENADEAVFDNVVPKTIREVVDTVRDTMLRLSDPFKDTGAIQSATKSEVKTRKKGREVVGRAGPGVGNMPGWTAPAEAGRRAGARVPPFSEGSRLMSWAARHGIGPKEVRHVAYAIHSRGLPSLKSPGWTNPPPTFVERGIDQEQKMIEKKAGEIGAKFAKMWVKRSPSS